MHKNTHIYNTHIYILKYILMISVTSVYVLVKIWSLKVKLEKGQLNNLSGVGYKRIKKAIYICGVVIRELWGVECALTSTAALVVDSLATCCTNI